MPKSPRNHPLKKHAVHPDELHPAHAETPPSLKPDAAVHNPHEPHVSFHSGLIASLTSRFG